MSNVLMEPMYDTNLFCEIWDSSDKFLADYNNTGTEFTNQVPTTISQENALMTYLLLFSRYGNNPIANYDVNQFKNKIFTIIWQYGPAWEKRLSMQEDIRNLTLQEITQGTKTDWSNEGTQSQNKLVSYIGSISGLLIFYTSIISISIISIRIIYARMFT